MNQSALIVEDDRTQCRLITNILKKNMGFSILEAENGKDALRLLHKNGGADTKIIFLDLEMPVMNGFETLNIIQRVFPAIPVIILTASSNTQDVVFAMKAGAADFISKPVNPAQLSSAVRNVLNINYRSRQEEHPASKSNAVLFSSLIGHDGGLADCIVIGRKAAACNLPVLITGETGTGKEMIAAAVHGESRRSAGPFVPVNCGAIPENLVESTLFGHERGAFTSAINKVPGKFQSAHGGTIFLDEIGELPLDAQVKLLRVLQQKEVEPVGAEAANPIDVRVVSATNRNLANDIRTGRFREDLYFRLNVLHIDLPPLRDRRDDIPLLIDHFMLGFSEKEGLPRRMLADEALELLKNYSWPGNVRELENILSRALAMSEQNELHAGDFSLLAEKSVQDEEKNLLLTPIRRDGTFKSFKELEKEIIALALSHHGYNISATARTLGMAKSTIYAKLEGVIRH